LLGIHNCQRSTDLLARDSRLTSTARCAFLDRPRNDHWRLLGIWRHRRANKRRTNLFSFTKSDHGLRESFRVFFRRIMSALRDQCGDSILCDLLQHNFRHGPKKALVQLPPFHVGTSSCLPIHPFQAGRTAPALFVYRPLSSSGTGIGVSANLQRWVRQLARTPMAWVGLTKRLLPQSSSLRFL
jgi:hypothetical protein